MSNRAGIISLSVFIIIVLAFTVYWQFGRSQKAQVIDSLPSQTQNNNEEIRIITALHQYKNGRHIIAGQTDVPTPCHALSESVSMTNTTPVQVTVAFTTTSNAEICAQVITSARFKTEFTAPENAVIGATWNGSPVQFNLIPAGPNDDLENFDIFIKG